VEGQTPHAHLPAGRVPRVPAKPVQRAYRTVRDPAAVPRDRHLVHAEADLAKIREVAYRKA